MRFLEFLKACKPSLPRGTFVAARFTLPSAQALAAWMRRAGIESPVPVGGLHVTILYDDEKGIPWQCREYSPPLELDPKTYKLDTLGGALVLRFENDTLSARHRESIEDYGAKWNYPSFKSHVTLSYHNNQSPAGIDLPTFPLYLSHEYSTPAETDSCD